MKRIRKPKDCVQIRKIVCSDIGRAILTDSGNVYFQGVNNENNYICLMKKEQEVGTTTQFVRILNKKQFEKDKIIDIVLGNNSLAVVTESGKIYGSGP